MAPRNRSEQYFRSHYAAIVDPKASAADRRHAYVALSSVGSRIRRTGIPEAENHAAQVQREFGIRRGVRNCDALRSQGVFDLLSECGVRRMAMLTMDAFAAWFARPLREATAEDVDRFTTGRSPNTARCYRADLRVCFAKLIDAGMLSTNPAAIRPAKWHRLRDLTPEHRQDLARIEKLCRREKASPSTRRTDVEHFWVMRAWAIERGLTNRSLAEVLWTETEHLEALIRWRARPLPDKRPRAATSIERLCTSVLRLFRASGHSPIEASDRVRTLKRTFRRNGSDHGPLNLLALAGKNAPPAPSPAKCVTLAETYRREIAELRARGDKAHRRLILTEQQRDMFHLLKRVGYRRSSLASFRFDCLHLNEADGLPYFEDVVTKRVQGEPVVPTKQIGNVTVSRWYIHPDDLELLKERMRDQGWDLDAYLTTRNPKYIPWHRVRDATFGRHMKGKLVSPVWYSTRGGHLTVYGVTGTVKKLMRERLHMPRGVTHPFRRRAVIDTMPMRHLHPKAAEALTKLKAEAAFGYLESEESDPALMFPELATPVESEQAPQEREPAHVVKRVPSTKSRRTIIRRHPAPRKRITLDELLRGA